jgi:hypothetical protein
MALYGWHDNSPGGSGSFGVADNWEGPDGPGVPGAGDDARVYGGPLTVTVSGQTVQNFGGAGGLIGVDAEITTLSGSLSVTGTLADASLVGGAFTVGTLGRCTVNATLTAQTIGRSSFLDGGAIQTVELADCSVRGANVTADIIGPTLGAGVGVSAGSVTVKEIDLQGDSLIHVDVTGDGTLTAGTLTVGGGGELGNPDGTGMFVVDTGGDATVSGAAAVHKGAIVVSNFLQAARGDDTSLTLQSGLTVAGSGTMTVYGGGLCTVTGDIDLSASLSVDGGHLVAKKTQVTIGGEDGGSLVVSGGGRAEIGSKLTHVRLGVGGDGEISVHEQGSRLTITGDLDLGADGVGRFSVGDKGRATVAGDLSIASGAAFVGDAGSSLTVLGDVALGTATGKFGSLAANFGGSITVLGTMTVGDRGGGGFRLLGGSDATVERLELAEARKSGTEAAPCDVTLTGEGTTLTVLGDVDLHGRGYGAIIVGEGAHLDVKGVIGSSAPPKGGGANEAAAPIPAGLGSLQLNGGLTTGERLNLDASTLEAKLSNEAQLKVSGAMTLSEGARIELTQNSKLDIGADSRIVDSSLNFDFSRLELKGSLNLSGASTLEADNNSTIEITQGDKGEPARLVIGDAATDGTSVFAFADQGSSLEIGTSKDGLLVVGASGNGEMALPKGGEVTVADVLVGVAEGSSGKILIASSHGALHVKNNVTVGLQGDGLFIVDGNARAGVGHEFEIGRHGVVRIGGSDPSQRGGELKIGGFLTINDGGRLSVQAGGEASDKGAFLREGKASVAGENAHWDAGKLVLTSSTVTVDAGGSVEAKDLSVHADSGGGTLIDLFGGGSIAIGGDGEKGVLSVSEDRDFEVRQGGDCLVLGDLKVDGEVKVDGRLGANGLSGTGEMVVNLNGRLDLVSAPEDASIGRLTLAGKLSLGGNDIHVADSYYNQTWASGAAFDRHLGVSGSGKIIGDGARLDVGGDKDGLLVFKDANDDGTRYTAKFTLSAAKNGPDITVAFDLSDIESINGLPTELFTIGAGESHTFKLTYRPGVDIKTQSLTLISNFDNVKDIELDFRLEKGSGSDAPERHARWLDLDASAPPSAPHAHDFFAHGAID